jgi:hypothetical protein
MPRIEHRHLTVEADPAPDTSGRPNFTQARLTAWRVAKLSQQSRTMSASRTSASSRSPDTRSAIVSTRVPGLISARASRAESTLRRPTLRQVRWMIWRCRLVRSTVVRVADRDPADAARGEVQRHRRTESAGADDQRVGEQPGLLAVDADLVEQDVAAVAEKLFVVHGGRVRK